MRPSRLLSAFCLVIAAGCSSENEPSVMSGNETSGSGGAGAPSSSAGKPATGTGAAGAMAQTGTSGTASPSGAAGRSSTGAGGSTSSGSAGSGMSASAGSGMSAAAGMSSSATAGMSASAGAGAGGSSGGAAGETGAMSGQFSPLCSAVPMTAAGEVPTKGGACTAADPQLCYKTCGPQSIGFKSETCMNGAYVEQSGCSFPDADYACYKIPAMIDAAKCPTMTPQATMPCEVDACTLCNLNGNYLDSSGAEKAGYCVCPMAGAAGSRKWSCASTTAWPCPTGKGC